MLRVIDHKLVLTGMEYGVSIHYIVIQYSSYNILNALQACYSPSVFIMFLLLLNMF